MSPVEMLVIAAGVARLTIVEQFEATRLWRVRDRNNAIFDWNPWIDNGDALKLAVTLGLRLPKQDVWTIDGRLAFTIGQGEVFVRTSWEAITQLQYYDGDELMAAAALRRCIVKAAVALAQPKSLPEEITVSMTEPQVALLQRLIATDRAYHTKHSKGEPCSPDERGVEISPITGINPRSARALIDMGIAESVQIRPGQTWLFLGKYKPYDEDEKLIEPKDPATATPEELKKALGPGDWPFDKSE